MGDRRGAWIGAWVGVATVVATAAVASRLPGWFSVLLAAVAVVAIAMTFAPVFNYWPFGSLGPTASPRRLTDLYKHVNRRWRAGHFVTMHNSHGGIGLEFSVPGRWPAVTNRQPTRGRAFVEVVHRDHQWSAFVEWEPIGRYAISFPWDFAPPASPWPPPAGRYVIAWSAPGGNARDSFRIDEWGRFKVAWPRRMHGRVRRRLATMRRGFNH